MKRARLLAFVVTAAMATTVFLGGTVARYQTTASIDDTATVAKWGVKLTMAGDLYGYNYNNVANGNNPTNVISTGATADSITVEAKDASSLDKDQVAPGTVGDVLKFSLSGETEVDVDVDATATGRDIYLSNGTYAIMQRIDIQSATEFDRMEALHTKVYSYDSVTKTFSETFWTNASAKYYIRQNMVVLSNNYYPVVYSLTATGITGAGDLKKASEIATALQTKLTTNEGKVEANENLTTTFGLNAVTLTWKWLLDNDVAGIVTSGTVNDVDTILGALSNGSVADSTYVVKDNSGVYEELLLGNTAETDGYVFAKTVGAVGDAVGSVKTAFSITVTVSQVD